MRKLTNFEKIQAIQSALGLKQDGILGPITQAAIAALSEPETTETDTAEHRVKASSFADVADQEAYHKAIAEGKSRKEALAIGDDAIGCWGDATGDPDGVPMCALPPEVWQPKWGNNARGQKVTVTVGEITATGELRDTMPHMEHIENGAGIDLNPAFCKALKLTPPVMVEATWKWGEK